MSHRCGTCGIEMPSPGGLAVHELAHLQEVKQPPQRARQAGQEGTGPGGRAEVEAGRRNKGARAGGEEAGRKGRSRSAAKDRTDPDGLPGKGRRGSPGRPGAAEPRRPEGADGGHLAAARRRRRPSRAMASGGATFDAPRPFSPAAPEPAEPRPAQGGRRKLDSTVPVTALLVLAALIGGVLAAATHSPGRVPAATGREVVQAGASGGLVRPGYRPLGTTQTGTPGALQIGSPAGHPGAPAPGSGDLLNPGGNAPGELRLAPAPCAGGSGGHTGTLAGCPPPRPSSVQ